VSGGLDCAVLRAMLPSRSEFEFAPASFDRIGASGKVRRRPKVGGRIGFSGMAAFLLSDQHWLAKFGSSASSLIQSLGGPGVLLVAVADSSFLSIPEGNDVLIVVLSTGGSWGNMAYYVSMTVIGSVIGCFLLYSVGRKGGSPLLRRRFSEKKIERAENLFKKFGILTIIVPSIIPPPMPFKIFVLSAGVFRVRLPVFLTAVVIGRSVRYCMWGILAVLYGNSVKMFMQQNLKEIGIILVCLFVLAIASAIFFQTRRMKRTPETGGG
jgi:membrane protein DedA with SNARE-associated domain